MTLSADSKTLFLNLVRLGLGNDNATQLIRDSTPTSLDWDEINDLAARQGLSAIIVDGVDRLPETFRPPKQVLLQWIGETLQRYEYRFELYRRAIADLAAFYNENGFKMMLLKGYACSLNWPKPEHRPCGDIDIWLFGSQEEADSVLEREKRIKVDISHHHHTVFYWRDFMVENHYDFINVHRHRSHNGLEDIFKSLGKDDSHSVEIVGEKVYLPSPNLHALFLVRHALNHFASIGINLRQVLDWAFLVKNHTNDIDWDWLNRMLEKYNMKDFYQCLNAICIEDLGFEASIFHEVAFNPTIKEKVLADILNSGQVSETSHLFFKRMMYRFKRWKGSAWKQELCFKESRRVAFWSGVWNHLLKPSSI